MSESPFKLSRVSGQAVSDEQLLADLRRVANDPPVMETVTQDKYERHGVFDASTVIRHFGTWNKGLIAAGLSISNEFYSEQRHFDNLLMLWQHYGRQPRRSELTKPPSTISQSPYKNRYRGWMAALEAFVNYANSTELRAPEGDSKSNSSGGSRSARGIPAPAMEST